MLKWLKKLFGVLETQPRKARRPGKKTPGKTKAKKKKSRPKRRAAKTGGDLLERLRRNQTP